MIFVPYMTGFGGTETVINNLFAEYNSSSQKKYEMGLVSIGGYSDSGWQKNILNKKIFQFSSKRYLRNIQYILFLPGIMFFEIFMNADIDIIISTNPLMWSLAYSLKKILHRSYKVMSWYHYSPKKKPISNVFLKRSDRYLAISTGVANQFVESGIGKDKIRTVFNPVLRNSSVVQRTKAEEPCHFVYVGRIMLDGQKNLRKIIDGLSKASGNWRLTVFGEGDIQEVSDYMSVKGILNNVSFEGFKRDPWEELSDVDCLLLSSKYEGFGMVLAEAISVGIPVLSVDCDSGPSDIVNEKNGILVDKDDQSAFDVSLQKFINKEYLFRDSRKIKESISNFYSENYFNSFLKSLS